MENNLHGTTDCLIRIDPKFCDQIPLGTFHVLKYDLGAECSPSDPVHLDESLLLLSHEVGDGVVRDCLSPGDEEGFGGGLECRVKHLLGLPAGVLQWTQREPCG